MCKFNFIFITFIYYCVFLHTIIYSIQFSLARFSKFIAAYEIHMYMYVYIVYFPKFDIYKNTFDSG